MSYQGPKGTQDLFGSEILKWEQIEAIARHNCKVNHVSEIRTPVFEHTEVFKRENDSSDVVNKEMYTFKDFGNRSITLRPEGTAGVIRSFVQNKLYANPDLPIKLFYIGPNFRYENPQKGRTRIHHQFGVEFLGMKEPLIDVEVMALGLKTLSDIGLTSFKLHINSLGDESSRLRYRTALKEHFAPVLDELCEDCHRRYEQNPLRILDCKIDKDHPAVLSAPSVLDYLSDEAGDYFKGVQQGLDGLGIDYVVDPRIVRGLDYYTHTVFEVISTHPEMGAQSTLFAGGRYDQLVHYFGGPEMSAMGFGMGIERLLVACEAEGVQFNLDSSIDVYGMPLSPRAEILLMNLNQQLRELGFVVDMDYGHRSMKAQFKSADRYEAKLLFIVGDDEIEAGCITVKNTETKVQHKVAISEIVTWCQIELGEH